MKTIPKIAHFNWFGNQPFPLAEVLGVGSFAHHNPDWKIKVYVSDQSFASREWLPPYDGINYLSMLSHIPNTEIIGVDLKDYGVPMDGHFAVATDVFRQEILYREGGVYSDMDVIWLCPMSELEKLSDDFQCTVCMYHGNYGHHNMSVIVAEPGSIFLSYALIEARAQKPPYSHMACGTTLYNQLFPTLEYIDDNFSRILALEYKTFYPYSIFSLEELFIHNKPELAYQDGVMAVHWFSGHPLAHDYIANGCFERMCSINSILKTEGIV